MLMWTQQDSWWCLCYAGKGSRQREKGWLGTRQMKMVVPLVLFLNLCKPQHLISKSGDNCASASQVRAETKFL